MRSKPKKLSAAELKALEAKRDIDVEILQSIGDMKAGKGKAVTPAEMSAIANRHPQAILAVSAQSSATDPEAG